MVAAMIRTSTNNVFLDKETVMNKFVIFLAALMLGATSFAVAPAFADNHSEAVESAVEAVEEVEAGVQENLEAVTEDTEDEATEDAMEASDEAMEAAEDEAMHETMEEAE